MASQIKRIGVVGAGTMGNGIAQVFAQSGFDVRIVDAAGAELLPEPGRSIALCRCGGSGTKPFCDKSHRQIGFCDPSRPDETGETERAGAAE